MWGDDTTPIRAVLEATYSPQSDETYAGGFDAILVADCLYWAHLHRCVGREGRAFAWVAATRNTPVLMQAIT